MSSYCLFALRGTSEPRLASQFLAAGLPLSAVSIRRTEPPLPPDPPPQQKPGEQGDRLNGDQRFVVGGRSLHSLINYWRLQSHRQWLNQRLDCRPGFSPAALPAPRRRLNSFITCCSRIRDIHCSQTCSIPSEHETWIRCWINVGPPSQTVEQHWSNIESMSLCLLGPCHRAKPKYSNMQ